MLVRAGNELTLLSVYVGHLLDCNKCSRKNYFIDFYVYVFFYRDECEKIAKNT